MISREESIADLLMGAAYADDELDGSELNAVRKLLSEVTSRVALPASLESRLNTFDAGSFSVETTVAGMGALTTTEQRRLLELIAAVHEADDSWAVEEDLYLRQVGDALGLDRASYADLTLGDLSIEGVTQLLKPPPLPKR